MQTRFNQRWRDRRDTYRPAGEPIDTRRYEVAPIDGDGPAKAFVLGHHYSASYPAARLRYGLYRRDVLAGVAVFSVPQTDAVLTNVFPVHRDEATELGRFVLLDDVPANGETWFLSRCCDLLRHEGIVGVVSHSDPFPRTNAAGAVVFAGHVGNVYQALSARYLGRGRARWRWLMPDGTELAERAQAKVRAAGRGDRVRGKGYEAVVELLCGRHGVRRPSSRRRLGDWLDAALATVGRRVRHPGNFRYAFPLTQGSRRALRRRFEPQDYPKWSRP